MNAPAVAWAARSRQIGAKPFDTADGTARLTALWAGGRFNFDGDTVCRLAGHLRFAAVGSGLKLIHQDEPGDFMLVVLDGTVGVERSSPGKPSARLAEARPGDVIGELALLDAGPRLSDCVSRTACIVAVLETDALARLTRDDAPLALALMAALARRLSLRLRQVSARLSALLSDG